MVIYFKNGMTTEVSQEIGESIMREIVNENNGYVKFSKVLQAVYDLNDNPFLVINLNEVVYIR